MDDKSVTVACFGPKIEILSTKTRPKKLTLIGSDGKSYCFLLKGKEDLHIDQRLLQFIRVMNALMVAHRFQEPRVYSVTPLGNHIGLIEWVDKTVSFYALFRQWQHRQLKKLKEMNASLTEAKPISMLVTHHPKDTFQKALNTILREANLPRTSSRSSIAPEILEKV